MDFIVSLLLQTALVPIVVSVIVAAGTSRISRLATVCGAVGLAAGFFAGWAQQEWTTLLPERYLDWLPWVCLALGLVSIGLGVGLRRKVMWSIAVVACLGAAWLLVPDFPRLQPARPIAVALVAAISLCSAGLLERAASRLDTRWLTVVLMATGTAGAIVLAQSFALKFAQIIGMLTAALAGGLLFSRNEPERSSVGLPLAFLTIVTNLMFIGYANSSSSVPTFCYALIAVAPLGLCLVKWTNSPDGSIAKAPVAALCVVATILLCAVVPALLAHPPWKVE